MRKTLLINVLFFCTHHLFSQQDSLLKKFKYRINHFQAIDINLSSDNNYQNEQRNSGTLKSTVSIQNIGAFYEYIKSTDKIFFASGISVNGKLDLSSYNFSTAMNKTRSFATSPSVNILDKWFSHANFKELGIDMSGHIELYRTKENNSSITQTDNNSNFYAITLNIGIGKGRLEDITTMQSALWLYKELAIEKKLSREASADELYDLGQAITTATSTRVLDSRRRTKFILETVDHYLQQKGLIDTPDIKYFSSLNDILFFSVFAPRTAGTEKYIRLRPRILEQRGMNGYLGINDEKFKTHFTGKAAALSIGINRYIPTSLKHQNNFGAEIKLSYSNATLSGKYLTDEILTSEFGGKDDIRQAGLYAFYAHGIYPNTRTEINFSLITETGYQNFNKENSFYNYSVLFTVLNYFISYRSKFTFELAPQYLHNYYTLGGEPAFHPNTFYLNFKAGLTISL
jgi:hypothetical protein